MIHVRFTCTRYGKLQDGNETYGSINWGWGSGCGEFLE
jgi:hypothetical protein